MIANPPPPEMTCRKVMIVEGKTDRLEIIGALNVLVRHPLLMFGYSRFSLVRPSSICLETIPGHAGVADHKI